MILTKQQVKEFEEKSRPLMEWLSENFHPHVKVVLDSTSTEILESSVYIPIEDYVKD